MVNEPIEAVLDKYDSNLRYAKKVDKYIEEYMDNDEYTLDDIRGILETMPQESIQYLLSS